MKRAALLSLLAAVNLVGCASKISPDSLPSTQIVVTATLRSTATVTTTVVDAPTAAPATSVPLPGITSTQLYVRREPSSSSPPLAIIPPAAQVHISGKDPGGNWYQIIYPEGTDGQAWIFAEYVEVQNKEAIPILGPDTQAGPSGEILERVNVRSGPGPNFEALGTLSPKDVVTLIGKDSASSWFQIRYDAGPDGKGWIAASFVQAGGADVLPIVAATGGPLGTTTPTPIKATQAPAAAPAVDDHDSAESPAVEVTFSPAAASAVIYSSDISAPEGDSRDWIAFTPYQGNVRLALTCSGNGQVSVDLLTGDEIARDWGKLSCGGSVQLGQLAHVSYAVRLSAIPSGAALQYTSYSLTIDSRP